MRNFAILEERTRNLLPVHVITAGYNHPQERCNRPRGASFYHVFIVEQGCGIFETESGTQKIGAGTAVFLPKNFPIQYYGAEGTFRTGWVTFDGPEAERILKYFKANGMETCPAERLNPQPKDFFRMIRQNELPERLSAELYRLIVAFFTETKKRNEPRTERAKQFITSHCHRDLSVEEVAMAVEISPSLLYRLFRAEGKTPVEYLRQIRIQKAKELLLLIPEKRIGDIAAECGFSDFAYFCKVFRETEGISPKAFREKYRI